MTKIIGLILIGTIGCTGAAQFTVNTRLNFDAHCPLATQELSADDNSRCLESARQSCEDRGLSDSCWAQEK